FYMWWGGSSAPARFLVPVVPLAAPFVALAFARARGWTRATVLALGAFGALVGLVAIGASDPRLLFSPPHGTSSLLRRFEGSVPVDAVLPTFTEERWPSRGRPNADGRRDAEIRGRLELLCTFDPQGRRALDYATGTKLSPRGWLERTHLDIDLSALRAFVPAVEPIRDRPNAFIGYCD